MVDIKPFKAIRYTEKAGDIEKLIVQPYDKIDEEMSKASYEFGFGTDSDANSHYNSYMNESESESEWRYQLNDEGGHL